MSIASSCISGRDVDKVAEIGRRDVTLPDIQRLARWMLLFPYAGIEYVLQVPVRVAPTRGVPVPVSAGTGTPRVGPTSTLTRTRAGSYPYPPRVYPTRAIP